MSQSNGQSVQSDVLDAVVAALGGNAAGAYRCQLTPFSNEELQTGVDNVIPDEATADYQVTDDVDQVFRFKVRHMFATAEGVDKAVDARMVRGTKLILADPTLGGLVTITRWRGNKWEFEDATMQTGALAVTYEAEFSTARNDPSRPGT